MRTAFKIGCYLLLLFVGVTQQMYIIIPITLVILSAIAYTDIQNFMDDMYIEQKPIRRRRKRASSKSKRLT